ncbi:MAG: hypothetical protein U0559_16985 [Anaerolineae bacterium]
MLRDTRRSLRLGLPIAIGLMTIATLVMLLSATPARAIDQTAPIDSPHLDRPARPAGPLQIPIGTAPSKFDGQCPTGQVGTEWGDALAVNYPDLQGISGTVLLKHDNNYLYVCLQVATGTSPNRFASVYLDTLDTRSHFAGPTDYGLRANILTGTLSSAKGTGSGGYTPTTLNGWSAGTAAGSIAPFDGAEYQIPIALTGGACGLPFGLAVYHHWVLGSGATDFGWPSNHWYDQPQTWQEVQLNGLADCTNKSDIAYIYRYDLAKANDFKALLTSVGYGVDLIPLSAVTATNFTTYTELIVADDTGNLDQWGTALSQVNPITASNKPILGLGEGGYAFFGRLGSFIGWPNGWHGPAQFIDNPAPVPANYYADPYDLSGLLGSHIKLYQAPNNEVGIYVPGSPPSGSTVLGWELITSPQGAPDHAPLISDGCSQLWGFSESPTRMTPEGQRLFLNAVKYGYSTLARSCKPTPPPPVNCVTIVKTAEPPSGSTVQPGDTIKYTVAYTVTNDAACTGQRALLLDKLPEHTLFVPGSAGGVVPNFDNTLTWDAGGLTPGATGSKSFQVSVLDTACRQQTVTNTAKLQTSLGVFTSNTTTHKVNCPPVIPPNNDPPYAESEIQIYPYPLVTGSPTHLSVRVFNNSATSQTVTVTFQTSPNRFGIGIPFSTLAVPGNPRVVTIGPAGYAEVVLDWTPVSSGHYCIAVKIESAGYAPIYTYRNLDVTEDLKPGVTDVLTFTVMNPTANPATIDLVVDNTCPGWSAVVNPPSIANAVPGVIYTATLSVTPPNPAVLGTACHIDVQGWIGTQLIGGIRKLDVPPVNLPHSDPPWLEQEISTIPTPPISGTVNQACIELQNPLGVSRQVTVTFKEADFGAGIGFTPFATQTFTLPPNSLQKYCVNWTPLPGGTLHRCLLVELDQPGWQTQRSQRNLDLVRRQPLFDPSTVHIPFSIGNPFPYDSEVDLNGILIGLNQWMPKFVPDPPPDLPPGGLWTGELMLVPAVQHAPQAASPSFSGDVVRVDVELKLNGQPASGFSVEFAAPLKVYLPLIQK